MSLTSKQEKFIQGVLIGLSKTEAYKQAYNTSQMKESTINNNAYKLMQNNEILTRYHTLKEEADKLVIKNISWNMDKSLEKLEYMMNKSIEDIDKNGINQTNVNTLLGTIKEMNRITGISFKDKTDYELKKARLELDKSKVEASNNDNAEKDGVIDEMLEDMRINRN